MRIHPSLRMIAALFLCFALLLGTAVLPVRAVMSTEEKADALYSMGLFKGKGTLPDGSPNYALEDSASRSEAATMLIRLLGKEQKASAQLSAGALKDVFTDVPKWAKANVAWLYENSYVNGIGGTLYGGGGEYTVTAQQFAAMVLRSLGYQESAGDFRYADALSFAVDRGLLTDAQKDAWASDFRRAGMVEMCYNALYLPMRQSDLTLLQKLTYDGIFRAGTGPDPEPVQLSLNLKYKGGGKTDPWSVEEVQSAVSPLCADFDGDGETEILFVFHSIYCLDGDTGNIEWFVPSGHDITEGLTVMDIYSPDYQCFGVPGGLSPMYMDVDGDGVREIVTFHNDRAGTTLVGIYDARGAFKYRWTTDKKVIAAHISDLNGDGRCEFAFGYGVGPGGIPSLALYDLNGQMLPGWPKVQGYGFYSDSITSLDLDGDGSKELVMLYDEEHVPAYHMDGTPVIAAGGVYAGLEWGGLPVCESILQEEALADWAANHDVNRRASATNDLILGSTREKKNCIMGTYGSVVPADVDGDGTTELVFTCMMVDGSLVMRNDGNTFDGVARYFTAFILNTDRTRYVNEELGFDWRQMPTDTGVIRGMGAENILRPDNSPVCGDVDGDGFQEILFSSHDGRMHCFSLDCTEHGAWPFALSGRADGDSLTFATKPIAADLNGDGTLEVIFASYTESDQVERRGRLFVLDCLGRLLAEEVLPPMWGLQGDTDVYYANGAMAAPAVADVDGDGLPEIVVTTLNCGVCVYDVASGS